MNGLINYLKNKGWKIIDSGLGGPRNAFRCPTIFIDSSDEELLFLDLRDKNLLNFNIIKTISSNKNGQRVYLKIEIANTLDLELFSEYA